MTWGRPAPSVLDLLNFFTPFLPSLTILLMPIPSAASLPSFSPVSILLPRICWLLLSALPHQKMQWKRKKTVMAIWHKAMHFLERNSLRIRCIMPWMQCSKHKSIDRDPNKLFYYPNLLFLLLFSIGLTWLSDSGVVSLHTWYVAYSLDIIYALFIKGGKFDTLASTGCILGFGITDIIESRPVMWQLSK
jgi:hypothetical protein